MVLEVPDTGESEDTGTEDPCEALMGYSSLQECHKVILAESICQPRRTIYVGFLLLAPVLILVFAYI